MRAVPTAQGKPLTIDPMNVNLAKADVYLALTKKQITSWADLRNNAAHGNYGTYRPTEEDGMKSVFADTFYYIALLDAKDSAHERAVRATRELDSATVTTAWVLLELANALSASRHRTVFARFLDLLRANPNVIIYEAEKELFDRGVEIYRDREDQQWSLTDCISFVVMQREGLTDALTGDRNFEQAGFRALLR